ncbi:nitroreductase family protein [bacterium]|nr:nitroreductase family protein [bacterium]
MNLFEAIKKRHTVREFTGETIPKEDVLQIVDAARSAATGYNIQPWHFIAIMNEDVIQHLSKADAWIAKAGAVIAVVMDPSLSDFTTEDASAAIENMLLAVTALGYGACWVEGDVEPHEAEFKLLLNIPTDLKLFGIVPVGVPAGPVHMKEKKPIEDVLHWETF